MDRLPQNRQAVKDIQVSLYSCTSFHIPTEQASLVSLVPRSFESQAGGRPICPLLLTRDVAIIEIFLYIENVEQGGNPRNAKHKQAN